MKDTIDIVFDGPPGPTAGRFVEVESPQGTSISFGEWVKREDGYWVLRIPNPNSKHGVDALHPAARKDSRETLAGMRSRAERLLGLYSAGEFPNHEMFEDGVIELCRMVLALSGWLREALAKE